MAISLVTGQKAINGGTVTTSTTVTLPSAPTAGNLLVCVCTYRADKTLTLPTGFSLLKNQANNSADASHSNIAIGYRVVQSGDAAGWTFTIATGNGYLVAWIGEYSGAATSTPGDQSNGNNGATGLTTVMNTGSVTPTTNGQLLVGGWGFINNVTSRSYTNSFAEESYQLFTTPALAIADFVQTTAAATSSSASWTTNVQAVAVIGTFKAASGSAPGNTVAPAVSGTLKVGQTLSTSDGTWSGSPTSYAYKWQRSANGTTGWADIGSATANTYTLTSSDDAQYVRSVVTATNANGSTAANSSATGQIHTSYTGSTTTAITDSITTAGTRRRHGATTTAITDSITTAAKLRRHGATTTAITDTITTAAKLRRKGSTTTSITDSISTAGRLRARSVSTTPLSLAITTTGHPRCHGSTTTSILFSASTAGSRRRHGSSTFAITDGISTAGLVGAFSTSTLPITVNITTIAGSKAGRATLALTAGISTAGKVRAHSSSTLPEVISITTAGTRHAYGTSTLNELFVISTSGKAVRYGSAELDETLLITTIAGGNLILGVMIQGELSFTSIGMIAPNQTGDIDFR